jgi:hypothetical protein
MRFPRARDQARSCDFSGVRLMLVNLVAIR